MTKAWKPFFYLAISLSLLGLTACLGKISENTTDTNTEPLPPTQPRVPIETDIPQSALNDCSTLKPNNQSIVATFPIFLESPESPDCPQPTIRPYEPSSVSTPVPSPIPIAPELLSSPKPLSNLNENKLLTAIDKGLNNVPGEYIVKMRAGTNPLKEATAIGMDVEVVATTPSSSIMLFKSKAIDAVSSNSQQVIQKLRALPDAQQVEPNYIVQLNKISVGSANKISTPKLPASAPNDPLLSRQYHHKNVRTIEAWSKGDRGRNDVILAVVDTGVDENHPDLKIKMVSGSWNTLDNKPFSIDKNGHGTHCAGTAAAITNNAVGGAGIAPNVKLLNIQVLSSHGYGSYASAISGIIMAADKGAKVISIGFQGSFPSSNLTDAVNYALSKGTLVVAAMGDKVNKSTSQASYPANIPGVLAVGATDENEGVADFSQAGSWNSVVAPGVNILSTLPTYTNSLSSKDYGTISSTSAASSIVAGAAALVWSKYPHLNPTQLKNHIESTADNLNPKNEQALYGHGRVNVERALQTKPN